MAASKSARFEVDLGPLELPAPALNRIEAAIQKAVLLELASVDIAPAFAVTMSRPSGIKLPNVLFPFPPGRTRGLVFVDPTSGKK